MTRADQAVQSFKEGFSCSQAVFSALSKDLGLEREKALRISQAFGGGMARMGETCGAVTGAFMAIGLKHGRIRPEDEQAKEKTYALVHEFVNRFKAVHRSIVCRELLGFELSTTEGHRQAQESGLFENLCPKLVRDAVEILEQLL